MDGEGRIVVMDLVGRLQMARDHDLSANSEVHLTD